MTLTRKFALAFLLIAITAAAIVAVSIRLTNPARLNQLVLEQQRTEYAALVINYYQQTGSLGGIQEYLRRLEASNQPQPKQPNPPNQIQPLPPPSQRRNLFGLADAQGFIIVPLPPQFPLSRRLSPDVIRINTPLEVDGIRIGTILSPPIPIELTPQEKAYLDRTNESLTYAALSAAALALIVGLLLARTLTRPLRALTEATEKMAGGDLNQQVTVNSKDEIGELAASFNRMSREVANANTLRRQMTADIAHDLRTPLTVIAGYVESMRDGDLAPTPERLDTIYAEIDRLQRLVADLRLLAHTDAGELHLNLQAIHPRELLESTAAPFKLSAEQKGITLRVDTADELPLIQIDESRMNRVLSNLISNALRHTPTGGIVTVRATHKSTIPPTPYPSKHERGESILISVEDTGEGIPAADLPHIFDRFHRADKSRTDTDGASSGLGLAIAKALVEAHGGRIWAESEVGKRTKLVLQILVNPVLQTD